MMMMMIFLSWRDALNAIQSIHHKLLFSLIERHIMFEQSTLLGTNISFSHGTFEPMNFLFPRRVVPLPSALSLFCPQKTHPNYKTEQQKRHWQANEIFIPGAGDKPFN